MSLALGSNVTSDAGAEFGQGLVGQDLEGQNCGAETKPVLRPGIGPGHEASDQADAAGQAATCKLASSCERAGVAPAITVTTDEDRITVQDNGDGIDPDIVARVVNYAAKTSSNAMYVSPTRGQQGNAFQTLLAMEYAVTGLPSETIIESRGVRHLITFFVDAVLARAGDHPSGGRQFQRHQDRAFQLSGEASAPKASTTITIYGPTRKYLAAEPAPVDQGH